MSLTPRITGSTWEQRGYRAVLMTIMLMRWSVRDQLVAAILRLIDDSTP